jgi:hypothetical protein
MSIDTKWMPLKGYSMALSLRLSITFQFCKMKEVNVDNTDLINDT